VIRTRRRRSLIIKREWRVVVVVVVSCDSESETHIQTKERIYMKRKRFNVIWCMIQFIYLFNLKVNLSSTPVRDLIEPSP
jgi:hypothetical protein